MIKILNHRLINLLLLFVFSLSSYAQSINSIISENPYINQTYFTTSGNGVKMTLSYDSVIIANKNYIRNSILKTFDKKGRLMSIDSSRCLFYDTLGQFAIRTKTRIEYKGEDTVMLNIEDSSKIIRQKLVYHNGNLIYSETTNSNIRQNYQYDNYGNLVEISERNPCKFKYELDERLGKITIYGGYVNTHWMFYFDTKTKLDLTTPKSGRLNKVQKYYYNSSFDRHQIISSAYYSYLKNGDSIGRIENARYDWGPGNVFSPDTLSDELDFEYSGNSLIRINVISCLKGSRNQKTFKHCQQYHTNYLYRKTGRKLVYWKSIRTLLNDEYKDKSFKIKYCYFYD